MVKMEGYYSTSRNHIRDMWNWNEIDKCHLSYLEMEESPEKIEQRNKLEDYIHRFLCEAPHHKKFTFPQTEHVLYESAIYKKDFSAYKASAGFNAIQLYASNLLSQPWRNEYKQIKTYCGFYKHQIDANLINANVMFELLGYHHVGNGLLKLNGPICFDRVIELSRDCLVAYVECQIVKAIWEEVKLSWIEVLNFRKSCSCTPEQAVKMIKLKQTRGYQEHSRSLSDTVEASRCCSYPPTGSHNHLGIPITDYYYHPTYNQCCSNYQPTYYPAHQAKIIPQFNINGYYYNGYATNTVPTAKLIELEPNSTKIKNNNDVVDGSTNNSTGFEDWDYVYKNLESQGYSKDLGERGDLLSPKQKDHKKAVKSTNLDEILNNLTVKEPKHDSPKSSYDNLLKVQIENCKKDDKSLKNKWQCNTCTYLNETSKDVCDMCSKSRKVTKEPPMEIGGAECSKCTLVNAKNLKTCEACGESLKDSPTYI